MKKLNVTVDGTVYEVILESKGSDASASTAPAPAPAASAPAASAGAGGNAVNSPLAATIVSIDVSVGQSVNSGDRLFTLEAMKMNSYVTADQSGKVAQILVKEGDQVSEGQPLLQLG